jgi:hypothetical protein
VKHFYVYAYIDSRTGTPFYVGKGSGKRDKNHLLPCELKSPLPFYRKLRKMLAEGNQPTVVRLVELLNESDAFVLESFFILALGRRTDKTNPGPLWNLSNGGEGSSGHVPSPEARRRYAEAARRTRNHLGHKQSDATREKIRAARRNQVIVFTPEARKHMSEARRGFHPSAITRLKMSRAKLGKPRNPLVVQATANKIRAGKQIERLLVTTVAPVMADLSQTEVTSWLTNLCSA